MAPEASDRERVRSASRQTRRTGRSPSRTSARAQTYRGLNRFVDGGERGDEYTYCPPDNDAHR